jgi:hypothetical protein
VGPASFGGLPIGDPRSDLLDRGKRLSGFSDRISVNF